MTENSKIKCYKYWPGKTKGKTFGQFAVSLVSKEKEHGLVTRVVLLVRNGDASTAREVYHFQYKEWPDHGLPSSAATFRHLLHLVDAMHDRRGSILVHCR